jgi:dihydrofolate synthase/folylpolyglutamate synthase
VDVVVTETGLGGRFDATNVLKTNLCAIITHIDLDHTDRLGDTKEKIAFEKAGIIKPNSYVITSEGYEVIKDRADEVNSMMILTSPFVEPKYTETLSLKGEQQAENLALVLSAIKTIFPDISDNSVIEGLKKVKNPCRFQYIKDKNLIIDGAHNPNCFEALRKNLDKYFPNTKRNYVFGCLNTKDYGKMLKYIEADNNLNEVYVYHFKNENSVSCSELKKATSMDIKELKNIHDLIKAPYDTQTVVCGSFYMLNELFDKTEILA